MNTQKKVTAAMRRFFGSNLILVLWVTAASGDTINLSLSNFPASYTPGNAVTFNVEMAGATQLNSYDVGLDLTSAFGTAGTDFSFVGSPGTNRPSDNSYVFSSSLSVAPVGFDATVDKNSSANRSLLSLSDFLPANQSVADASPYTKIATVTIQTTPNAGNLTLSFDSNILELLTPSGQPVAGFSTLQSNLSSFNPPIIVAAANYWQHASTSSGDSQAPANWSMGLPNSQLTSYIDNGGTAALSGGILNTASLVIGATTANNAFVQSAGSLSVAYNTIVGNAAGSTGSYAIQGGTLNTGTLAIGNSGGGVLNITNSAAKIVVTKSLSFGANSTFSALPGSMIEITGNQFTTTNTASQALDGLVNSKFIFDGGPTQNATYEVSGKDLGPVAAGFINNFALGTLQLGSSTNAGNLTLVDGAVNQPSWSGGEALYVSSLIIINSSTFSGSGAAAKLYVGNLVLEAGSTLNLNGLHLYYQTESADPTATVETSNGGQLVLAAPEPGTLSLLIIGVMLLFRYRWRRRGLAKS